MQLRSFVVLATALIQQTAALLDERPAQTAFVDLTGNLLGFSPKPTPDVGRRDHGFFQRRATQPGPTCGFISGNFYNPVTCESSQYCAANTDNGIFGCCNTYSPLPNGDYTFSRCEFRSRCFDYTAADSCTGSCASNEFNGFCTNSDYPYCQTFSLTDLGLSAYGCNSVSDFTVRARLSATTTFSVTPEVDEPTQAPTIGGGTSGTTEPTAAGGSGAGQSQGGGGGSSVVGPAVGGAIGGLAVILIAAGGFFWLRMKHKKNKLAAAAAAAGGTTGVGNGTNGGPGNGPGPGPGFAAGATAGGAGASAYAANEYYKTGAQDNMANGHEPGVPMYPGPPMTQMYPPSPTVQSPLLSEMPSSPAMTTHTNMASHSMHQPQQLSEIDGTHSTLASSGILAGGVNNIQTKSVSSNSVLSGSGGGGGERNELENTSTSGQVPQTSTSSTTGAVPSAGASSQPQSQNGMGYTSGPGDWNRPYHELEGSNQ